MFKEIHDIITDDNSKSGVRPSPADQSLQLESPPRNGVQRIRETDSRPLSMPGPLNDFEEGGPPRGTSMEFGSSTNTIYHENRYSSSSRSNPPLTKERPQVHPKPERMHANPSHGSGIQAAANTDILAQRFAQLRTQDHKFTPLPYPISSGANASRSPDRFSATPVRDSPSVKPHEQVSLLNYDKRPSGPRFMPQSSRVPPHPPKVPLDTQFAASLPRAPSPTYSPGRNMQSPASIAPPRSTLGSAGGSGGKPLLSNMNMTLNSSSAGLNTHYHNDSNGHSEDVPLRVASPNLPNVTAVSAQELYDRLRSFHILLIDVRTRQEYDDGHIFAKSIICIEPLTLRYGMATDDLEERLVMSPEKEQLLFERRNEYDLIVYYDQNTSTNRFLEGPPNRTNAPALRSLRDTLYEFDYGTQLKRPPVVLLGGLNAWIDLVGPQALQTSRTFNRNEIEDQQRLQRSTIRPIGRRPTANSSQQIRKRRLRDYDPLDADEEQEWLEKAKKEEVQPTEYRQDHSDGDTDSIDSHAEEAVSPLVHSYEEFLRRFPEPSTVQQSMVGARIAAPSGAAVPLPPVPSRPPPAVPRPSYSGVSEPNSSQLTPASRQHVLIQPPLYTSRTITHYLKLPRTGLINFSVTCYMNATIQCLLATIPLSQFFLDERWRNFVQKNWKGSNGIMPGIYSNLVRSLWRNDVQAVRPTSFRNFCTRLNREWGIDRQQDAKEFLEFLVDCLHEDLNVRWEKSPLAPLTTHQELVRERLPINQVSKLEWDRYIHRDFSFISTTFAGQHASRLRCRTCGNTSTTYEAFYSISVEIPRSGRGDVRECLRSYCQEEMLSGDEVWKCPYCRREREATKRITITRLPQVLVIHFKRFSASKTESARKVHTPIDFPIHGLNMDPYMAPTSLPATTTDGIVDAAITPPFQYDAYAVMRHIGQSGNGGHYVALVRDAGRGCWRKFDDEKAVDFDPHKLRSDQRLQNEHAYIVFYGRSAAR